MWIHRHRGGAACEYFGADVTAVCNTKNTELVRSLRADGIIDYTQKDFTKASGCSAAKMTAKPTDD